MGNVSDLVTRGRRILGRARTKVFRKMGLLKGDWNKALPVELQFWESVLKDGGRKWDQEEWRNATNPNFELQADLRQLISAPPGSVVRILDVGSGPLTRVGKRWEGRSVEIVPADPLANDYNTLLARLAIRPLVPAVFAHGEKLLEQFKPESFDLAYASNSLDHTYDPVNVIRQMLAVVKTSGYVYLWHVVNEGLRERYAGLHQWNFDYKRGEFTVSDGRKTRSVTALLQGQAEVTCEFQTYRGATIVVAKLRKLGAP